MSISWDSSDLSRLVADLGKVPARVVPEVAKVVEKGAVNVKGQARELASGIAHAPAYPASITYDVSAKVGEVEAVVGPDKDRRQGALGNILEYGTSKNAPIPHLGPALDREGPRFEAALADVLKDLL